MKKSLIAGVTALVLSFATLTGCTTTPSTNNNSQTETQQSALPLVSVSEINHIEKNAEGKFVSVKHGEKVRIENVEVFASYEHKMFIHQAISLDSTSTIEEVALEVQNPNVDFRKYTTSVLINLEGEVSIENQRVILKDAVVTKIVKENPTGEPKNLILYPDFNRGTVLFASRFFNGLGAITTLQVAEDVGEITTEGKTIKVVFPGEDLDLTNPNNENVMDFVIPAGLDQEEVDFINEFRYGGLKKGQCFESIVALEYVPGSFNYVYVPYIGSNPEYIGGHARAPMTYASFDLIKANYLPDLINAENLELFPNLKVTDEADATKSGVYSYLPDDLLFDDENEYTIYFTLNTYQAPHAFEEIKANLEAQEYKGGKESIDDSGMITSASWVSDKTAHPLYKVTVQNVADMFLEASVSVDAKAVKPYERFINADTYDELLPLFNKSVDNIARRNSVLLPQVEGFKTALTDITPELKELGFETTNITLDRINETVYGQEGFLPIIQERIHFNFNWEERPTVEGEGDEMHFVYDDALKLKIKDASWKIAAFMSIYLPASGFEYSLNEFLYAEDENGKRVPVYVYYNPETSETVQFDIRAPRYNKDTAKFEGDWSIVIFDEIIHGGLSHRMKPAPEMEPMYIFPGGFPDYFKKNTGCEDPFIIPEFGAWDMKIGKESDASKEVRILMIPIVDNAVESYTATLEKAGYTVEELTKTVTVSGKPTTVTYYKATNANTDVVIEFQFEEGLLMIQGYKK